MTKAILRYFLDEEQEAKITEILADKAKKENQKPQEIREHITSVLTNMIIWSSNNLDRIKGKGQAQLLDGSTVKITEEEFNAEAEVPLNDKWTPPNPNAKLRVFTFSGQSFMTGLHTTAKLQNILGRKLTGVEKPIFSCVEECVYNIITDTLIADYTKFKRKELEEELKASLTEDKPAETADKPAEAPKNT